MSYLDGSLCFETWELSWCKPYTVPVSCPSLLQKPDRPPSTLWLTALCVLRPWLHMICFSTSSWLYFHFLISLPAKQWLHFHFSLNACPQFASFTFIVLYIFCSTLSLSTIGFSTICYLNFHFLLFASNQILSLSNILPLHFQVWIFTLSLSNLFLHSPLVFICKFILADCSLQLFELLGVVRYQGSLQDVRRKTEQSWLFAKTQNPLLLSWNFQCQICVSWSLIPIPQFGLVYFLVTTASDTK